MTKLDQFESVFLMADKTAFRYEKLAVEHVLVVSDFDGVHGLAYPLAVELRQIPLLML